MITADSNKKELVQKLLDSKSITMEQAYLLLDEVKPSVSDYPIYPVSPVYPISLYPMNPSGGWWEWRYNNSYTPYSPYTLTTSIGSTVLNPDCTLVLTGSSTATMSFTHSDVYNCVN